MTRWVTQKREKLIIPARKRHTRAQAVGQTCLSRSLSLSVPPVAAACPFAIWTSVFYLSLHVFCECGCECTSLSMSLNNRKKMERQTEGKKEEIGW
mmetsp:Transcript_21549/g.43270  ORF Transcript_21549/g.43270 Transcript_21549/m.43270 type:complete len:96 (+) Transcript_21549:1721-2008(+)